MIRMIRYSLSFLILGMACDFGGVADAQPSTVITGQADRITVADGYQASIFARRLGHISALARRDDGTLYAADKDSGRIFEIRDRRMDGTADVTRALPHRFDQPTGLIVSGQTLFVADHGGIWRVDPTAGTPDLIAPFARSGSMGAPHPIVQISKTELLLGMRMANGTSQVLSVDLETGRADLKERAEGQILDLSRETRTDTYGAPWVILDRERQVYFGPSLTSARPLKSPVQAVWLEPEQGRAFASHKESVREHQATFSGLSERSRMIVSGFSDLARPGALLADERGLFVSDQEGGRIWRIYEAQPPSEPPEVTETRIPTPTEKTPVPNTSTRPQLPRGSTIERASQLPEAEGPKPASSDQDGPK